MRVPSFVPARRVVLELVEEMRTASTLGRAVRRYSDRRSMAAGVMDGETELDAASTAAWTNAILNALAKIGRKKNLTVFPNSVYLRLSKKGRWSNCKYDSDGNDADNGEYLVDHAWGRWPNNDAGRAEEATRVPGLQGS